MIVEKSIKIEKMPKGVQPSNAMMPARYIGYPDTNTVTKKIFFKTEPIDEEENEQNLYSVSGRTDQNKVPQNAMDSDEDTISTARSEEGTLTSDEVDQEACSNSALQGDKSILFSENSVFKIKDEIPDFDENNSVSSPVNSEHVVAKSYAEILIKQELPNLLVDDENETNSKLYVSSQIPDSNQGNSATNPANSEQHVFKSEYTEVLIKQESPNPIVCYENETNNSKLHQIATDTLVPNENDVCSVSSRDNVLNYEFLEASSTFSAAKNSLFTQNKSDHTNSFITCDVIIKKEIDLPDGNASDFVIDVKKDPHNGMIENEPPANGITDVSRKLSNISVTAAVIKTENEPPVNDLTDVSRKLINTSITPPAIKTSNLNSSEAYSDVLHESEPNSECFSEKMETCITSTNSASEIIKSTSQTPQTCSNQPQLPINSNLMSEKYHNESEMKNSMTNERSNLPTANFSDYKPNEIENDIYLYGCEISENMDTSSSHLDSAYRTPSPSSIIDFNEIVTEVEATINSSDTVVEKSPTLLTSKSKSTTKSPAKSSIPFISCHEGRICDDSISSPSKWIRVSTDSEAMSNKNSLPLDLLKYSKYVLSFNVDDIDKCLNYISSTGHRKESRNPFFYLSKIKVMEKTNIFQTVKEEIETESSEVSNISLEIPQERNQTRTNSEPVVEKSSSNEAFITKDKSSIISNDNLNMNNQSKCSELLSILENEANNSNQFTDLSITNCNDDHMAAKEKSNVKCDNFKTPEQNVLSEIPSIEDEKDNSVRFNRIMSEVITMHEAMKTFSENVSYETASYIKSTIQSSPDIPVLKIKREKSDSMVVSNTLTSDIGSTVVQLNPELTSENSSTLSVPPTEDFEEILNTPGFLKKEKGIPVSITNSLSDIGNINKVQLNPELSSQNRNVLPLPSNEELQKIINSVKLNILPSSESKLNLLNSSEDMAKVKIEPPEIEEIILDDEIPTSVSVNVNISQPATTVILDEEVKILKIKRKKPGLQRINHKPKKQKSCSCRCRCVQDKKVENKYVTNNHFNTVNVGYGSNTFKTTAEMHGTKTEEINACLENMCDTVDKIFPNNVFNENLVVKIENTDDSFTLEDSNDSCQGSVKNNNKNSSLSKRTVYVHNNSNADAPGGNYNNKTKTLRNSNFSEEKRCILKNECVNEPPVKKLKSHQKDLISNDTNKPCFGKQKLVCDCETEKSTKFKGGLENPENSTSPKRIVVFNNSNTIVPGTSNNVKKIKRADLRRNVVNKSLGRRGRNRASSSNSIGRNLMDVSDLSLHILEWNTNWLIIQWQNQRSVPICEEYKLVKDTYEDALDYYSTYFPLHLLSIWLAISDSWKKCPPSFDAMFENQAEKPTYVKIGLCTTLDMVDYNNWPKREDMVLFKATKSDGTEETLFGHISIVMHKDISLTDAPEDIPLTNTHKNKASTMKKVKLELFSAEVLHVPILATVKVQILINLRIALLQFNALRNFKSPLRDIIYNPKRYVSHWKFIPFISQNSDRSLASILDSMTSRTVTVVDIPSPSDSLSAISQITSFLTENKRPILIGLKSEESFLQLTNMLRHHNPILAIKKREVRLPDELKPLTVEERSTVSCDIFDSSHVTLTLLPSIYLGDLAETFEKQNKMTCIVHDAHLCTEVETTLLLKYGVINLVLIGNQEAEIDMHPLLKEFHYDVALFKRFCKVISEYASS